MKFAAIILGLAAFVAAVPPNQNASFSTAVDTSGTISLPKDFRKDFAHLGSWFVPDGDASGFHDVYTQQATVDHYRKTGSFPDGAVLVKELRGHESKPMTTGVPAWATKELKQWFVMVKDSKGRFPNSPQWGDGWGWALFKPGEKGNVSTNYKSDCMGCHIPAKSTDSVYVEAYPTLKP